MENLIEKLRELAIASAEPEHGRYRIAAAVLDKAGNILSTATNSYVKTHPKMLKYARKTNNSHRVFLHAEMRALIKAKGDPYKIVVVRVGASGQLRLAKPCEICSMAIKDAGIKFVEYSV